MDTQNVNTWFYLKMKNNGNQQMEYVKSNGNLVFHFINLIRRGWMNDLFFVWFLSIRMFQFEIKSFLLSSNCDFLVKHVLCFQLKLSTQRILVQSYWNAVIIGLTDKAKKFNSFFLSFSLHNILVAFRIVWPKSVDTNTRFKSSSK